MPVHEDFQVRRLIEATRALQKQIASKKGQKMAFHFDVSCYAPYEVFDSVLYSLLFGGVIVDPDSGEVLDVSNFQVETQVFVELGFAPKEEPDTSPYARYTSRENVLSAIPTVAFFANNERVVSDLHVGAKECLCAGFYREYYKSKNPRTNPLDVRPLSPGDAKKELELLFSCTHYRPKHPLPQTAPLQRSFLILLHEKLLLFTRSVQTRIEYVLNFGEDMREYLANPPGMGLWDFVVYFEVFLEECAYLCKQSLRLESITPDCTIPLLSAPDQEDESSPLDIAFYDFGGNRYAPLDRCMALKDHCHRAYPEKNISVTKIESQWQVPLRRALAGIYSVKGQKMPALIENFVLTPEFALALIVLKARMSIKRTIVWQGGTGVGKSELLSFFSILLNRNSNRVPDQWQLLGDLFKAVVNSFSYQNFEKEGNIRTGFSWALDKLKLLSEKDFLELIQLFLKISKVDVSKIISGEKEVISLFPYVAHQVAKRCVEVANQYPFVHKTPTMAAVIKVPQPSGDQVLENKSVLENAPISTLETLEQLLKDLMNMHAEGIYSRMLMTNTKTAAEIKEWILMLNKNADKMDVVGFIDECNTTSYMGLLKEILCDHTLDGHSLAPRLFFVTAENPADEELHELQEDSKGTMSIDQKALDHRGIKATASDNRQFTVRISAPSLKMRQMNFFEFKPTFESHFLRVLFATQSSRFGLTGCNESQKELICQLVTTGQSILRKHPTKKIHVSIRDIVARVLKLLRYFLNRKEGLILLGLDKEPLGVQKKQRFLRSLTMSLCIAYFFRFTRGSPFRDELCTEFDRIIRKHDKSWKKFNFKLQIHKCLNDFFVRCDLSKSLAPTFALKEIIFCTITCIDACVPLAIIGPAGCGKTLGFSLALECMKGSASLKELFKSLKQMIEFRYQCSVHSTDKEIREVYESAVKRQKGLEQGNKERCRIQCTVLLDEASLPKDQNLVIKETHDYLDHPVAATVILSNNTPDVPNTNRCVLLLEPELSEDDLILVSLLAFSAIHFFSWQSIRYLGRM